MTTSSPPSEPPLVAVVVMAKNPVAGQVKTRLSPELSAEQAAGLYHAMLVDRFDQLSSIAGIVPAVALFGGDSAAGHPAFVPPSFEVLYQGGGGLGEGLEQAARHFASRGMAVILVDSDSPTLPLSLLQEAVTRLRAPLDHGGNDLVVGPSDDGGYYLLGLRRLWVELFQDIPWSTDAVVALTLERAANLRLSVRLLPVWWDVDTPADLTRLRGSLHAAWWPERTAQWLREDSAADRDQPPPGGDEHWAAPWTRLASRNVYATPWLRVREDQVRTPEGRHTTYSVVDCGQCVGVLPFVDPDTVLLVRQYRYVADRVTWEMPTGGVHPGEDPETSALRELAEEARVHAAHLVPLGAYHTSKSVMDETAHLFVAHGLTPAEAEGDPTEYIHVEPVPFARAVQWAISGEITDGMTLIALLRVALLRAEGDSVI